MKRRRTLLLIAAGVFLVAAFGFGVGFFAYAFYVVVLVAAVAWLMGQVSLDALRAERHMTLRSGQIGDEAVVTVGVRNVKPVLVPWVVMEDVLGAGLGVLEGTTSRAMVMKPGGSATLRYRVRCDRRGYHRVGPVLCESGDFFGLVRRFVSGPDAQFITVYPRVAPIDKYSVPTHRPLGETTVQTQIHEDPTRIAGVREYRPGDPLRRVHWKASAKTGVLHAKIYDPSCLLGANIILDFNERAWEGERMRERSEFAATVAASLASHLAERGVELGLVSNGVDAADVMEVRPIAVEAVNRDEARKLLEQRKATERLRPVQVRVRRGGENIVFVMEALARLELSPGLDLAEMIQQEHNAWPREHTAVLIVPRVTPELFAEIARLKTNGFSVLVLLVDNAQQAGAVMSGVEALRVPMLHLREESDLHSIVL